MHTWPRGYINLLSILLENRSRDAMRHYYQVKSQLDMLLFGAGNYMADVRALDALITRNDFLRVKVL